MDPEFIPQDLVRCGLCETPVPPKHCDICHIHLCKACVGEHLSDESIEHYIVPFRKRGLTVQCENHARKICELHCEQCNIPICALCVSTGEHDQHKKEDILKTFARNIEVVQKDLGELETVISPKYEDAAYKILAKEAYLDENFKRLTKALQKQGQNWHREIDTIILILQSNIDDMYSENVAACHEYQDKLIHSIDEISEIILSLKTLVDTRDVSNVSNYKSRVREFGTIPKKPSISQLTFTYKKLSRENVFKEFGFLSCVPDLSSTNPPNAVPLSLNILFLDNPWPITEIRTAYREASLLHSVSCLTDDEFWVCGGDSILRLYNLQGALLQSVQTESGNWSWDIAVTRSGVLIYTDPDERSINVVTKTQTYSLIRLEGWRPCGVCSTSDDDILVVLVCDSYKQTKVVRYSDSEAIQSIQWDSNGHPLYSSGLYMKYVSENRNEDVCVSDYDAGAVVVVSAVGKLRFRYTGLSPDAKKPFHPCGITTDSLGMILVADRENSCIQILDQNGQFLHFMDEFEVDYPWGLCLDTADNLFVAVSDTRVVKKIQYYK